MPSIKTLKLITEAERKMDLLLEKLRIHVN
jgi:hypothetical protein